MDFPQLSKFPCLALDSETTGLQFWKDKMFGFSLSTPDNHDYYYDIRSNPQAREWLADEIKHYKGKIIGHNIKYDCHFFRESGIFLPKGNLQDTMIRAALIDEHLFSYDLDSIGNKYIGVGKETSIYKKLARLFGGRATKNAQMKNLHRAPESLVAPYAKQDTRTTFDLYKWQKGEIDKQELHRVLDLENRLLPVLVDIEHHGVRVDLDRVERAIKTLRAKMRRKQKELNDTAGFVINPNPSGSIHKLFNPKQDKKGYWVANDGTILQNTPAGKASINADALKIMKHPAATMILSLRQLDKTVNTFLEGHILGYHDNGIIHSNNNQCRSDNELGTGTGRLSMNAPALQQIPKRNKETAKIVRACFIPDEGQIWGSLDYEQSDFRFFAHYTQSPPLIEAYNENPKADFHGMVAELTGLPRNIELDVKGNAKQLNLGLVFGMGQGKMAQEMGLPYETRFNEKWNKEYLLPGEEAIEIFDTYHKMIPGVKEFLNKASSVARSRGYIKSLMDRHMRFPQGQFVHKAGGYLFQSATAEAIKTQMIAVWELLKGTESRMLFSVHDEINGSLCNKKILKDIRVVMEDFNTEKNFKVRVPMLVDPGHGINWWEASK